MKPLAFDPVVGSGAAKRKRDAEREGRGARICPACSGRFDSHEHRVCRNRYWKEAWGGVRVEARQ